MFKCFESSFSKPQKERKTEELIHHSDRGIQYCSDAYIERLKAFNLKPIQISMTENGDPYENALAERMNRTIKEEMLNNRIFLTFEAAHIEIEGAKRIQ